MHRAFCSRPSAFLVAFPILAGPIAGCAHSSSIAIGADVSDCRSSLRVGPVQCENAPASSPTVAATGGAASGSPATLEAAVDAYLANYGKPPREAVRALLEPSDENVQALLRKREATFAVASYLAERMSELRDLGQARDKPLAARLTAADGSGMGITLFERLDEDRIQGAWEALRGVSEDFPLLKVQVGLVGAEDSRKVRDLAARLPPNLTARAVRPEECNPAALPFLRIENKRTGQALEIDAAEVDREALRRAVASLLERTTDASAPPSAGMPEP